MKRTTIEDVAKAAGVSRQTVSRAINNKGEISPVTRERVLAVVEELNYQPNRLAQGMVTHRTCSVGIEIPDVNNPFFAEVVRGAQDVAAVHNYNMFLWNTDDDTKMVDQAISNLLAQGVDGIIAFDTNATDEELKKLTKKNFPLVLINRVFHHPNVSCIYVDVDAAASLAVEYLVEKGHERIGLISHAFLDNTAAARRVQGYQKILKKHNLPVEDRFVEFAAPTLRGGLKAAGALLKNSPEVTAIFAYNDIMAVGALRACVDAGVRVPEDCAIIGFDDIDLAALTIPSLTTIRFDKYQLGNLAMTKLIQMIESDESAAEIIELDYELIERESV